MKLFVNLSLFDDLHAEHNNNIFKMQSNISIMYQFSLM